jgi:hypothetical protein
MLLGGLEGRGRAIEPEIVALVAPFDSLRCKPGAPRSRLSRVVNQSRSNKVCRNADALFPKIPWARDGQADDP